LNKKNMDQKYRSVEIFSVSRTKSEEIRRQQPIQYPARVKRVIFIQFNSFLFRHIFEVLHEIK